MLFLAAVQSALIHARSLITSLAFLPVSVLNSSAQQSGHWNAHLKYRIITRMYQCFTLGIHAGMWQQAVNPGINVQESNKVAAQAVRLTASMTL